MTRALVPLATGFEEIEAVTIIDVLRRAEVEVTVAGLTPGVLVGSRGIKIEPDVSLEGLAADGFDLIVLPGGLAAAEALMADERVLDLVRAHLAAGRTTAAICAAPMVLAAAGVEEGLEVTSHPSVRDRLGRATVKGAPRVIRSGNVITSQGPGTAMEFALALVAVLKGDEVQIALASAMVVSATAPGA